MDRNAALVSRLRDASQREGAHPSLAVLADIFAANYDVQRGIRDPLDAAFDDAVVAMLKPLTMSELRPYLERINTRVRTLEAAVQSLLEDMPHMLDMEIMIRSNEEGGGGEGA